MFLASVVAAADHTDAWIGLTGVVVTAILTFIAVLVAKTRNENSSQHAASVEALNRVADKVDGVDGKLDKHIEWHMGLLVGPRGFTGPRGDIGHDGSTGIQGVPGDVGIRGIRGDVGDTGPRGPRGTSAA